MSLVNVSDWIVLPFFLYLWSSFVELIIQKSLQQETWRINELRCCCSSLAVVLLPEDVFTSEAGHRERQLSTKRLLSSEKMILLFLISGTPTRRVSP